jgi:1-acyl-sn-glycerol-3-phosphate acyltransferase
MKHSPIIGVIYFLLRFFVGPIVRLIWIKKVEGLENIPKTGPAILAFNHQSYFDFICFIAVAPRNTHYLSAESFFAHPVWGFLVRTTGQIKVDRKSKDKHELHESVHSHLDAGKLIGIFPEGTRSPHESQMLKGFPGVVKYAIQKKAPVIPIGIKGTYKVMSRHDNLPRFKKIVEIIVGTPILFEKYHNIKLDDKVFGGLTHNIMLEISRLSKKEYLHAPTQ